MAAAALLTTAPFAVMLPAGASTAPATHGGRAPAMVAVAAAPRIPVADKALGAVPTATVEHAEVMLKPRDEAAVQSFIANVTDKRSPQYHHYLAPGAYRATFGPTAATIAAVTSQLRADGLKVSSVSSDGLFLSFSGTAGTLERAFGTGLERYRLPDGSAGMATTGAIRLPSNIAPNVAGVVGLDNLIQLHDGVVRPGTPPPGTPKAVAQKFAHATNAPTPCPAATSDALGFGGLTDDQILHAYGAFGLYNVGDFGAGQHVAIFEQQPFLASDIEAFDTCYFGATQAAAMSGTNGDLAGSRLSVVNVDGGIPQPSPAFVDAEASLDIEDVSAAAPGANIDVYETPNTSFGAIDAYAQIVQDDADQVISTSWFIGCEQTALQAAPGYQEQENIIFEQAAAQGQTVISAAGDTGDDTCNLFRFTPEPPGQNLLSVGDPQAQPYVLSVGGTTIDNATEPPAEHVWDDGAAWGAGGGGISDTWVMPSWQRQKVLTVGPDSNATDIANAEATETNYESMSGSQTTPTFCDGTVTFTGSPPPCREIPDVSAQADEFTGAVTIYEVAFGGNGWVTIGGTSSAAPLWAGMLALVNASSSCSAETIPFNEGGIQTPVADVGFVPPILYGIANIPAAYATSFNDIVSGNNDVYGLDNGLVFPARPGYDMASGLGSPQLTTPNGGGLALSMCQYVATDVPPVVKSLSATVFPTSGGTVTVTGSGFGTKTTPLVKSVQVGADQVTSFTVTSTTAGNSETLSLVLPPAANTLPGDSPNPTQDGAGPDQIIVTATDGESSAPSSKSLIDYVDTNPTGGANMPAVTGLSPYGGLETNPGGVSSSGAVTVLGSGFVAGSTTVDFGGVPGKSVTVKPGGYELTVVPPVYAATGTGAETCAPLPSGHTAANDICQVNVTVVVSGQTSKTSNILPPYDGPISSNALGVPVDSSGNPVTQTCGCEVQPQPSEFDYVPAPTITGVSTQVADPASLASEFGGPANLVTVTGTGMDLLTFSYVTLGLVPAEADSLLFPIEDAGSSFTFLAPAVTTPGQGASIDPFSLPVGFANIGGATEPPAPPASLPQVVYAGVPVVTSAVDAATGKNFVPDTFGCTGTPAAGCGPDLSISGTGPNGGGFVSATGPIVFEDLETGFDLALQNIYTVNSDSSISAKSLVQNPDLVEVLVCSNTACGVDIPADELYVYPPGDPSIASISPTSGPAHGGNTVAIDGSNLGCVTAVKFGNVPAVQFSNAQAILHCGQFGQVLVQAPPGPAGQTVKVSVATIESEATGSKSNTVSYTYTPSSPSAPQLLTVHPGAASATLTWKAPASDGGDPIQYYNVFATSPGRRTVGDRVPAGSTSLAFTALAPGVPWTFTVQAVSALGAGLPASTFPTVLAMGNNGYLVATANGAVFGFGSLASAGGAGGGRISGTVVGIAATPDAFGYWLATSTGAVYAFGNAGYYGAPALASGTHVVGIAASVDGLGYWLVSNVGTVYHFGDASGFGSASGVSDVVGIASTLDNRGYYLAEANGAVKVFGDAKWRGDEKGKPLNKPITGIAVDPATGGYWELGGDGGIFSFGAPYLGSMIGKHLNGAAVGMVATPDGKGYWIECADNGLFTFGAARYVGNAQSQAESAGVGVTI